MAVQHRLVRCRPARVWEVLGEGSGYDRWVVGTHDAREEDGSWPREGAALRYRLKLGPVSYDGRTVVRVHQPPDRLELEAIAAGGRASARIAFDIRPWGEDTLVILDEHPLRGRGWNFHHAAIDAVAQVRNRLMLSRLARTCENGDGSGGGS
ncbi:SRPBCC family protein [Streptomyces sp. NPDC031705]|uniref:SRPBCC family protein n=1 Tax=Streptomyces sp. NPDC031705 TaxID=3155729 RepID=UPI0033FBC0AD